MIQLELFAPRRGRGWCWVDVLQLPARWGAAARTSHEVRRCILGIDGARPPGWAPWLARWADRRRVTLRGSWPVPTPWLGQVLPGPSPCRREHRFNFGSCDVCGEQELAEAGGEDAEK